MMAMRSWLCSVFLVGLAACSSGTGGDSMTGALATTGRSAAGVSAPAPPAREVAAGVGETGGMQARVEPGVAGVSASAGVAASVVAGSVARAGSGGVMTMSPGSGGSGGLAGSGTAGAAGAPAANGGSASLPDCADGAAMGSDRKGATKAAGTGRHATGSVDFKVKAGNRIVRLQTTLEVPPRPKGNSTLFMWPGLEPLQGVSMNFNPIGRGVLQPVLTWGTSCAPGSRTSARNWWISSLYVNISSTERGYNGCYGGAVMDVEVGDKLAIDMRLKEGTTIWNQSVTNLSNNKTVDFDFDLKNQDQNWALFEIEVSTSTVPSSDVIFTDSVLTLAKPEPEACVPDAFGPNDYYTAPLASKDGTKCCLSRIVLREMGVPATTMDP